MFAARAGPLEPLRTSRIYTEGAFREARVYERDDLRPGDAIAGPAIICERNATTVIEPGWRATLTVRDHLVLERIEAAARTHAIGTTADPVLLEVFNNLFMAVAEQMGVTLANTAYSVNIKERLDFSCAIFDADGNLIANAPHMPVHLGSMGESVTTVIDRRAGTMQPGDVFVLNAPYNGGTHLPDVTVIAPVYLERSASGVLRRLARPPRRHRRHHAWLDAAGFDARGRGGRAARQRAARRGRALPRGRDAKATGFGPLSVAQYRPEHGGPASAGGGLREGRRRTCEDGARISTLPVVRAYMQHVQDNAEEAVRRVLDVLKDGRFEYEMDSGAKIAVAISIDKAKREATIDFTGTSAQQPTNFNAPSAVCKAAVLYVFRTLVDDEIPMNAGCLKPLRVVIPEGSMLRPRYPAAVVAGNVETSQTVTDALYGALGVLAASQGTMNNFTFGDDTYQYYETISGGAGAGPDFDGASVVQTHMTNSRLTDPEVLEWRFPVRLDAFAIRRGSGGAWPASRRRRRDAARAFPRADDGGDARQPSPRRAFRHGGRGAGRRRAQLGGARGRHTRGIRRDVRGGDATGRRVRDRDAWRRRIRNAMRRNAAVGIDWLVALCRGTSCCRRAIPALPRLIQRPVGACRARPHNSATSPPIGRR